MQYFPQLETGAMGQYPLRRTRRSRTIVNQTADGRCLKLADTAAGVTEWSLEYQELTDGEADSLAQFFGAVEGRLQPFTFLDPAGNLLCWSEKLDEPAWERAPLVTVTGGIADPFGGTGTWRLTNGGPSHVGIAQTLNAPGWYYYCLSVYARSEQATNVTLVRGAERSEQRVSGTWRRLTFASLEEGTQESVRLGVEAPGGATVELYGLQAEAQIGASGYKKTTARGGVYRNARLAEDRLEITAVGLGRHCCALSVIHGERF